MIKLDTILENYKDWEVELDDRFGRRLCDFLDDEQIEQIGFGYTDESPREIKKWNEANVLAQLKEDVEFGWEKACNQRSISAALMVATIQNWCNVLENGLHYNPDYTDYGMSFIREVDQKYGWHLTDIEVGEANYAAKQWQKGMNVISINGDES